MAQVRLNQVDRGGEWLSWSQEQRATYVNGFITDAYARIIKVEETVYKRAGGHVIESTNPKVQGLDGAVRSYVEYVYEFSKP